MRSVLILTTLVSVAAGAVAPATSTAQQQVYALECARVLDPASGEVTETGTIVVRGGTIRAEADADFRGTLGLDKQTPVGVTDVRLAFELDADAPDEQLAKLVELTERYCVVYQTLVNPPQVTTSLQRP